MSWSGRWWTELFDGQQAQAYPREMWDIRRTLGRLPAVLVVDVVRAFVGQQGQTLEEAFADSPTSCGPFAWAAMPFLRQVVDLAATQGWPLVYTVGESGAAAKYGGIVKGELAGMGSPMDRPGAQDIPEQIKPPSDALILAKPKASAFFNTSLPAHLICRGVDSVIVAGATTSGCVRATVVDAHSYGYPTFVVEDACFDRSRLSHGVNLFEMNAKYADVITMAELVSLSRMRPSAPSLPPPTAQ